MDTFSSDEFTSGLGDNNHEPDFGGTIGPSTFPVITPHVIFYPMFSLMPQSPIDPNNCALRSVFSLIGGGVMGFVFGPFLTGFGSTALDQDPNVSMKTKVIEGWKSMMSAGWRMAKTFGVVGVVFAASECAIEKSRGAHDLWNGVLSGCVTGALISAAGGPQAMAMGCAGFAAFSFGIDWIFKGEDPRDRMAVGSIEDLPVKSVFKKTKVEDIDKISIDDLTEEEINAILADSSLDVPATGFSMSTEDSTPSLSSSSPSSTSELIQVIDSKEN